MQSVRVIGGCPGATFRLDADDEALAIEPSKLVDAYGRSAVGMLLSVESGQVRFGFGGTEPVNAGEEVDALGHLIEAGFHLELDNVSAMRSLLYLDGGGESAGVMQVTVGFGS